MKPQARICAGCGKPSGQKLGGLIPILRAYWHLVCWRRTKAR